MDRSDGLFDGGFHAGSDGSKPGLGSGPISAPGSGDAKRYVPPAIDPRLLQLIDHLSRRRPPVAVTMGDAVIAFAPSGIGSTKAAAPSSERVVFHLLIDDRPAALQMAKSLYERLLTRVDPELLAADIDRDILPLLLESCVEDGVTAAEAGLSSRVELVAVEHGGVVDLDGLDITLDISLDGYKAGPAILSACIEDVKRIADLSAARPKPSRSYGDLEAEISIRAGSIWFDLGELRKLRTGDVLLVEEDESRLQSMAATVGECWLFPIDVSSGKPTLKGPFRKADLKDQEEWMMVDQSQAQDDEGAFDGLMKDRPGRRAQRPAGQGQTEPAAAPTPEGTASERGAVSADSGGDIDDGPAAPPADAAFDSLPVKLVFELGRLEMPLGQLQEIGPGHVLQLDKPLGEAVEIHASNRRIGQGEIVRIENQIGVRIVRLFGHGGA